MTEYPKISIVTPSFNQGQYIEQTILSVLNQNYPNLEYIIIDGGSTDNTVEIIKKYEVHLKYWVSEADKGQSDAINKGLEHCTGDIFNWLNSDDYLEPGALLHVAEEYVKQPYTALCNKVNVIDGTEFSHVRKPSFIGNDKEESIAWFNINQEGTWFSLAAVKKMNGVNQSLQFLMDLELWFKLLCNFRFESFRTTDKIVSNFRRHDQAKSSLDISDQLVDGGFLGEEISLFQLFTDENSKINYADFFEQSSNSIFDLNYFSKTNVSKNRISQLYLFDKVKRYYYGNKFSIAKKISKYLDVKVLPEHKKDIQYLRRKLLFKRI